MGDSAIFKHKKDCPEYKSKLEEKFGLSHTQKDRREFIEEKFSVLASSSNYFKRTNLESLAITVHKPSLNSQNDFSRTFTIV